MNVDLTIPNHSCNLWHLHSNYDSQTFVDGMDKLFETVVAENKAQPGTPISTRVSKEIKQGKTYTKSVTWILVPTFFAPNNNTPGVMISHQLNTRHCIITRWSRAGSSHMFARVTHFIDISFVAPGMMYDQIYGSFDPNEKSHYVCIPESFVGSSSEEAVVALAAIHVPSLNCHPMIHISTSTENNPPACSRGLKQKCKKYLENVRRELTLDRFSMFNELSNSGFTVAQGLASVCANHALSDIEK